MAKTDEHFMVDEELLERICGYATLTEDDVVLEVGAGTGNLTEHLSRLAGTVFAVEKNTEFYGTLEERFTDSPNVHAIHGDALKTDFPAFNKMVSNIPYSISRRLVKKLILHGFESAVLVVQKEFAEKLAAGAGDGNYRMISALTQSTGEIELLEKIPPESFEPPPKVWSTAVRLLQQHKPTAEYAEFLNNLFNHRNKTIRNIITGYAGRHSDKRPYELSPTELMEIHSQL
ncbi:MAG: 16S rRNA (adenine(1518)-N(6)/adenine(1519)-N(6))-dimethyltransferase RsmA [Candidatus Altiarchaeota archaeon]